MISGLGSVAHSPSGLAGKEGKAGKGGEGIDVGPFMDPFPLVVGTLGGVA